MSNEAQITFETVPMMKVDQELVAFAYWLQKVGELKKGYEMHFFAEPENYQSLWNAWVYYHRLGYVAWQIEQKLTDDSTGGWITGAE